jgi:hypothetical protein
MKSYSPARRHEGVPRSAAPRMGASANSSSEGLGNNSGVKRLGFECVPNCFRAPMRKPKTGVRLGPRSNGQRKSEALKPNLRAFQASGS